MSIIESIVGVMAPHECLGCGNEGALLCAHCGENLPKVVSCCYRCQAATERFRTCMHCHASSLKSVTAVTEYDGLTKALVWRLKFGRAQTAARDMARLMQLPPSTNDSVLVHIPTATSRARQRGYDQARLIARHLSRQHRLPHVAGLARLGQHRQVGASGQTRRQQLAQAFRVTDPALVAGKHIILVDDVVTTGATLEAAAQALRQAGARRVEAVVFARA